MQVTFDWKFYVALIATLAGVVVPVWLWRADIQARSLQLRIASQTALEPDVPKGVAGLKVTMDGVELERPYLTVLELRNNGSRPIPATDYEDSIQILVSQGVKIVRAQVTDVQPKDLQPRSTSDVAALRLSPLLLNPGDLIIFGITTGGGKPTFTVRARVAGISSIPLEDRVTKGGKTTRIVVRTLVALLLLFVYASCALSLVRSKRFELKRTTIVIALLANCFGAVLVMQPLSDELALPHWQRSLPSAALGTIAFIFALLVNRRRTREPSTPLADNAGK